MGGMFHQVWVKVREVGKWQQGDYVVKADADAVFVPQRLREWLGSKGGDTPHGVYFENCPNVQYGFFGNLEVMSRTAASVQASVKVLEKVSKEAETTSAARTR